MNNNNNIKLHRYTIRLSDEELAEIDILCNDKKIKRSDVIRQALESITSMSHHTTNDVPVRIPEKIINDILEHYPTVSSGVRVCVARFLEEKKKQTNNDKQKNDEIITLGFAANIEEDA